MNPFFTKLDSISPSLYKDFKNLGEQHSCGGGWTKYYKTDLSRNILLPNHLKNHFNLSYMTFIGDSASPHVDMGIGCRINLYLSENNATTQFFSVKARELDKPKPVTCEGCTPERFCAGDCACGMKVENLVLEDQFVAKRHDIYLLNVSKPHGVEGISRENYRQALSFTTDLPYETVYQSLKEYGSF
jgi:hypothetical protein